MIAHRARRGEQFSGRGSSPISDEPVSRAHPQNVGAKRFERRCEVYGPFVRHHRVEERRVQSAITWFGFDRLKLANLKRSVASQTTQSRTAIGPVERDPRLVGAVVEFSEAIGCADVNRVGQEPRRDRNVMPSIRRSEQVCTARPKDPRNFAEVVERICDVLQDIVRNTAIEGRIWKREPAAVEDPSFDRSVVRAHFFGNVEARNRRESCEKTRRWIGRASTDFQNRTVLRDVLFAQGVEEFSAVPEFGLRPVVAVKKRLGIRHFYEQSNDSVYEVAVDENSMLEAST